MLFFLKGFMYGSLKIEQCIELTDPTKLFAINQVAFNGNIALFVAIAKYSQINPFTKSIAYDYTQIHLHGVNSPSGRPLKGVIKCVKPVEKIAFTDNSLWVLSHVNGKSLLDLYEVFTTNDSITTEKKISCYP